VGAGGETAPGASLRSRPLSLTLPSLARPRPGPAEPMPRPAAAALAVAALALASPALARPHLVLLLSVGAAAVRGVRLRRVWAGWRRRQRLSVPGVQIPAPQLRARATSPTAGAPCGDGVDTHHGAWRGWGSERPTCCERARHRDACGIAPEGPPPLTPAAAAGAPPCSPPSMAATPASSRPRGHVSPPTPPPPRSSLRPKRSPPSSPPSSPRPPTPSPRSSPRATGRPPCRAASGSSASRAAPSRLARWRRSRRRSPSRRRRGPTRRRASSCWPTFRTWSARWPRPRSTRRAPCSACRLTGFTVRLSATACPRRPWARFRCSPTPRPTRTTRPCPRAQTRRRAARTCPTTRPTKSMSPPTT